MTGVLLDFKVVVLVFLRVGRVAHEQQTTHNEYNTNTNQHQWLGLAVQEALRSVIPPKPITDDELNNVDVGSDEAHFKCVVCNKVRGGVVALSWDGLAEWSGKGWVGFPKCPPLDELSVLQRILRRSSARPGAPSSGTSLAIPTLTLRGM